jgi:hypothetical protein
MKAQVLFDDTGNVGAVLHPAVDSNLPLQEGNPRGSFRLHPGQRSAMLEIPPELQHLKPRELHESIRVEVKEGLAPRLVQR